MNRNIFLLLSFFILVVTSPVKANQDDIILDESYTIRTVRVEGGWLADFQPPFDLPVAFSEDLLTLLIEKARNDFKAIQKKYDHLFRGGYVSSSYITCHTKTDQKDVEVIIRVLNFGMGQVKSGDDTRYYPIFPIPSLLEKIPEPVLKYAPRLGLTTDREYGTAGEFGFDIDGSSLINSDSENTSQNLGIRVDTRKSLVKDFHNVCALVSFRKQINGEPLKSVFFAAGIEDDRSPWQYRTLDHSSVKGGGGLHTHHYSQWPSQTVFGGYYDYSDHDFDSIGLTNKDETTVHGIDLFFLADGWWNEALTRVGFWFENVFPDKGDAFQKCAIRFGWENEISQSSDKNRTLGIELIAGAGMAFSTLPLYAGYYGGNDSMNFLYENLEENTLNHMPSGPIFRGVGEHQLSVKTNDNILSPGSSFWHINLNVALPLPFGYFPLIPDEPVVDEDATLKVVVKKSIDSGKNMLARYLATQHRDWDKEKVMQEANKVFNSIRPAVNYLVDKANAYAVKPILMMDLASVGLKDFSDQDIRLGLGAGIQLSVVNAKFEAGYMRTVVGTDLDSKNNVFFRMFFKTLF